MSTEQPGYHIEPIAFVRSPYREKFGIPRQPQLAPDVEAIIELAAPYDRGEALTGLEQSSHIWLQFIFHHTADKAWKPTVRPPRLGGNRRLGVFATRATHRPNALGLSVVKLLEVITSPSPALRISGCDLLDGTPIVDIKPYIPYVDRVEEAHNLIASEAPALIEVALSERAKEDCARFEQNRGIALAKLLRQILAQDPKPAYQPFNESRIYGMKLFDQNVTWRYRQNNQQWQLWVVAISPLEA
ncbi:tRNA-Thr(GGU) m(6)t(6)A37 methyltransferase TsaA [Sinobacterium caligoides]|uniref:tRNA-Thr(GGU) m(6)t(6)A37 methyltransferase TsaA n=1 Tax=Sinobacterium caligoides TaxID=933926 RepID=A0A3N2DNA4_9GAMM|nr:tRNA (N6-threonylcarbamoyladenosine(37)-N6)-methyltransferase TrmO [Sinobacterium caligoides]ROS01286.1 tRNA-Thr(GGU) m(6)t(6)A37 methyltransferase TsaA [Sinobacterium caligoides]